MHNLKALIDIIKKLNYILTDKQKKGAIIVFICMIVGSGLELLGVSVIYPFLQLMTDESSLTNKWYISWIYNYFPDISFKTILLLLCVTIVLIYIFKNIAALFCIYVQNKYASRFQRELSTLMLQSIMKRPYEYFVNTNSSMIMEYIHGDTGATYSVLQSLFTFLSSLLTVIMISAFLAYTDLAIAIAAVSLSLACFFFIVLTFKKKVKTAGKEMITAGASLSKISHEAVLGIKEVSVLDRRDYFVESFNKKSAVVEKITVLYSFIGACPDRILEAVCIGGFISIAAFRIAYGADPTSFIPILGTFAIGAFKILPSISKMSSQINILVYNQERLNNAYHNLQEAREIDKNNKKKEQDIHNIKLNTDAISFKECISVENVSWKYQNSARPVLRNLNLLIRKGESIGLIGSSGGGKTTLADIILGLYCPAEGGVYMDGIDIQSIPHIWKKTIGYVSQQVYLLDNTIRANIAFGLPADIANDEIIWQSLEKAQLADFVRELPRGLDTIVGERGVKFSGGQRQRLAIARALYEDPEILVFDEATSALDSETEAAVMQSIDMLAGEKTMIIIAHRMTTIRNCDKVYEISDGIAIERDKKSLLENYASTSSINAG